LTIPILIYLTMVPMWSRARKFQNVYAYAGLDMLSIILWLSAWAAMASYVSQGKSEGSDGGDGGNENEDQGSGCDNFAFGSPGRCQLSTGVTILGVFIMLGFVGTSWFSFRQLMEFKRTGISPAETAGPSSKFDFQQQTQGDFDPSMRNDDFDDVPGAGGRDSRQAYGYSGVNAHDQDEYAPMYQHDQAQQPMSPLGPTPTAPYSADSYGMNTGYGGAQNTSYGGAGGDYR
jgi:translocation protein SEC72